MTDIISTSLNRFVRAAWRALWSSWGTGIFGRVTGVQKGVSIGWGARVHRQRPSGVSLKVATLHVKIMSWCQGHVIGRGHVQWLNSSTISTISLLNMPQFKKTHYFSPNSWWQSWCDNTMLDKLFTQYTFISTNIMNYNITKRTLESEQLIEFGGMTLQVVLKWGTCNIDCMPNLWMGPWF